MLEGTVSCVYHSRINTDDTVGISPHNEYHTRPLFSVSNACMINCKMLYFDLLG